jgi:Fe-S cluster biogenesis protein NfuA
MVTAEQVQTALGEYREMLRVDGADLELTAVEAETVRVRLLLGAGTCADCILNKEMLEQILLQGLRDMAPAIASVVVDDPRVAL